MMNERLEYESRLSLLEPDMGSNNNMRTNMKVLWRVSLSPSSVESVGIQIRRDPPREIRP